MKSVKFVSIITQSGDQNFWLIAIVVGFLCLAILGCIVSLIIKRNRKNEKTSKRISNKSTGSNTRKNVKSQNRLNTNKSKPKHIK